MTDELFFDDDSLDPIGENADDQRDDSRDDHCDDHCYDHRDDHCGDDFDAPSPAFAHPLVSWGTDWTELVREHLQDELDPQVGRSSGHFKCVIENRRRVAARRRKWLGRASWCGSGAIAAGLLVSFVIPLHNAQEPPINVPWTEATVVADHPSAAPLPGAQPPRAVTSLEGSPSSAGEQPAELARSLARDQTNTADGDPTDGNRDGSYTAPKMGEVAASRPVLVGEVVRSQTVDEGLVLLNDKKPARKFRRQWLQRIQWRDARNGARMEMVVPREQVLFVPLDEF